MLKLPWVYLITWEIFNNSLKFPSFNRLYGLHLFESLSQMCLQHWLHIALHFWNDAVPQQQGLRELYKNNIWDLLCACLYSIPNPWAARSSCCQYADHRGSPFLSFVRQMNGFQLIARLYFSPGFLRDPCWRERRAVVIVVVLFAPRGVQSGLR